MAHSLTGTTKYPATFKALLYSRTLDRKSRQSVPLMCRTTSNPWRGWRWMERDKHDGGNLISFGRVVPNTFSKLRPLEDCLAANLDSTALYQAAATRAQAKA